MPLDFAPFQSLDFAGCADLNALRFRFAETVTELAADIRRNVDFVRKLETLLPEGFTKLIGEGSTRRVYATPLGVSIKLQRETVTVDPLSPVDLEARGGAAHLPQLENRRRGANSAEMLFAVHHPLLFPRVYGYFPAFGITQRNTSVLVVETAVSLQRRLPGDTARIKAADMALDGSGLWIFDSRLTSQTRPTELPSIAAYGFGDPDYGLGNLGITRGGKYVFLDAGNYVPYLQTVDESTWWPKGLQPSTGDPETRLFATREIAATMLTQYEIRRKEVNHHG